MSISPSRTAHKFPKPNSRRKSQPFLGNLRFSLSLSIALRKLTYSSYLPAMSYVPPHLRNSSAAPAAAAKTLVNGNSDHFHSKQLNGSYSQFTSAKSNNNGNSTNSWNAGGRSSGNYASSVPEPVVPQWKPSDRVLRLSPEQVR